MDSKSSTTMLSLEPKSTSSQDVTESEDYANAVPQSIAASFGANKVMAAAMSGRLETVPPTKIPLTPETKRERLRALARLGNGITISNTSCKSLGSFPPSPGRRGLQRVPSFRNFPGTESVNMRTNPRLTLQIFGRACYQSLPKKLPVSTLHAWSIVIGTLAVWNIHQRGMAGDLDILFGSSLRPIRSLCEWIQEGLLDSLFWSICGLLSTIGLGSGLQTGALFLFPHVCRLAVGWCKLQTTASALSKPPLLSLMWSVAWPGFLSGGGSAVGELVPFVLGRVIKEAGGDPFAMLNAEIPSSRKSSTNDTDMVPKAPFHKMTTSSTLSSSTSQESLSSSEMSQSSTEDETKTSPASVSWRAPSLLLANSRATMESQLSHNPFWKIFLLAVVPNGLFDLAGLVCGAADVRMWDFFLATWTAKALVRTPLQTCGLALAVIAIANPASLFESNPSATSSTSQDSRLRHYLETWGKTALAKFVGEDEFLVGTTNTSAAEGTIYVEPESWATWLFFSLIRLSWTCLTVGLFVLFIVGTVEQIAQHHVRTNPGIINEKGKLAEDETKKNR